MPNGSTGTGGGAGGEPLARLFRGGVVFGTWFLSLLSYGLQALGAQWVSLPDPCCDAPPDELLEALPEGHPERLCPHLPMSDAEAGLRACLDADP